MRAIVRIGAKSLLAAALLLPAAAARPATGPLAAAERGAIVERLAGYLENVFYDAARGREIAGELRRLEAGGALAGARDPRALAEALTAAMHRLEDDPHLSVGFEESRRDEPVVPEELARREGERLRGLGSAPAGPPPLEGPRLEKLRRENFGFPAARILPGNVGYLQVDSFPPPGLAEDTAAAAIGFLHHVDALIVDLRANGGGAQPMVNLLASYFFPNDGRELLTSSFLGGSVTRVSRVVEVPGPRLEQVDLYLLVGPHTFSAGEAFAYILQQLGRATVVGQRTPGGGRHNAFLPLGRGLTASISIGSVRHPRTGTSWQGTGVVPDHEAPLATAVEAAHRLSLQRLADRTRDPARKEELLTLAGTI